MKDINLEELHSLLPGDKVLRVRRRQSRRRRLRQVPTRSAILQFFNELFLKTPFLPMMGAFLVLMVAFGTAMYFVERNAPGTSISSWGEAIWWALASVETMGTPYEPATGVGHIIRPDTPGHIKTDYNSCQDEECFRSHEGIV